MEPYFFTIVAVLVAIVGTICLVPVLLFRPLMLAISGRISNKQSESDEMKQLRSRVAMLESQVNEMYSRMGQIEDTSHFAHKVLEDVVKKTNPEAKRPGAESAVK